MVGFAVDSLIGDDDAMGEDVGVGFEVRIVSQAAVPTDYSEAPKGL